ncbi:LAMI_0D05886g1_1 [Lachancea mirantina]|uniref:Protein-lysine N-methyltransferase EFM5 n=1 Tax=Lachancea mirantina TaxID=1230905 RepID=A0A1G4JBP5_9SACH|nr:LAMI_0D05886g1_1 [Lachancea mirantina]
MSESDEEISLSANALAALQEFQLEEHQRQEEFQKLYEEADRKFLIGKDQTGMELFEEDWQLSQFWYTEKTASLLADALLQGADENTVVAVVSAPSVYAAILKKYGDKLPTQHIYLFEYDKRFELMAGKDKFFFYDYSKPLEFENTLKGKVDRLLIDPPFLNRHCQENSSIAAKALLAPDVGAKTSFGVEKHRMMSCTGERMESIIAEIYPSTKMTTFMPEHANGLSNEFRCYADFEWDEWTFRL